MKRFTIIFILALTACDRTSSPEGRSQLRDEKLLTGINNLKNQNKAIIDSIKLIRQELNVLKIPK